MRRRPPSSPLFPSTTLFRSLGPQPEPPEPVHARAPAPALSRLRRPDDPVRVRSEEHTSELQSRQYLVCRLLLEKKNVMHFAVVDESLFIDVVHLTSSLVWHV